MGHYTLLAVFSLSGLCSACSSLDNNWGRVSKRKLYSGLYPGE